MISVRILQLVVLLKFRLVEYFGTFDPFEFVGDKQERFFVIALNVFDPLKVLSY